MPSANDSAYDHVFVQHLQDYGKPGDTALSLGASGNSPKCARGSNGPETTASPRSPLRGGQNADRWPDRGTFDGHLSPAQLRFHGESGTRRLIESPHLCTAAQCL